MEIRIASLENIPTRHMPGRDLRWIVSGETLGTHVLGMAIMDAPAHSVVRPCHAHSDVEEVLFVFEGQGEAWVEGQVASFKAGDAVFFPANSKHQVRNTGPETLRACAIFSHADPPETYLPYEGEGFDAVN
jgi:quercetin dioxygenase-like cupin family protein